MTESKALIGPMPVVYFGAFGDVRQIHDLPKDTMDPRYALCFDHHPACDCREAALSESINEYRSMWQGFRAAAVKVLQGHRVFDHGDDGDRWEEFEPRSPEFRAFTRGDGPLACQCTGCQIVRAANEYLPTYRFGVVKP